MATRSPPLRFLETPIANRKSDDVLSEDFGYPAAKYHYRRARRATEQRLDALDLLSAAAHADYTAVAR